MTVPTTNLVSYYKFDANAKDIKSTNDCTVTGATLTSGKVGGGYSFDGSGDYLTGPQVFDGNGEFTFAFWFKTTTSAQGDLVSQRETAAGVQGTGIIISRMAATGEVQAYIRNTSSVIESCVTTGTYNDGDWHLAIIYRDSSNYLNLDIDNGTETIQSTNPVTGDIADTNHVLRIGAFLSSSVWYAGDIDEVGIWTEALSSGQISELYNSGTGLSYDPGRDEFIDENQLQWEQTAALNFDTNNTTQTDLVNEMEAAVTSATYNSTGKISGCYDYSGSSQYITLPGINDFITQGDHAFSVWAKTSSTGSSIPIVSIGDGTHWFAIRKTSGEDLDANWDDDASKVIAASSGTSYSDGQWHHIVAQRNGSTYEIHVDGSLAGSTAVNNDFDLGSTNLKLGTYEWASVYFTGSIDAFNYWPRALSTTEISKLYNDNSGFQYPFVASTGWSLLINGITAASINGIAVANINTVNGM